MDTDSKETAQDESQVSAEDAAEEGKEETPTTAGDSKESLQVSGDVEDDLTMDTVGEDRLTIDTAQDDSLPVDSEENVMTPAEDTAEVDAIKEGIKVEDNIVPDTAKRLEVEEHLPQVEGSEAISLPEEAGEIVPVPQGEGSELGHQGEPETITISLEEATQIFLQQQGIQGAVQIAPGTYLQVAADGTLGSSLGTSGDPLQVIATGDGNLVGYSIHAGATAEENPEGGMVAEVGGQFIRIEKASVGSESMDQTEDGSLTVVKADTGECGDESSDVASQSVEDLQITSQCQVISTAEGQFTVAEAQYVQEGNGVILNSVTGEQLNSEPQLVSISEGKLVPVAQGGQFAIAGTQLPSQSTVHFSTPGTVFTHPNGQIAVASDGHLVTSNSAQYSLLSGSDTDVTYSTATSAAPAVKQVRPEPKQPAPPRQPDLNSPITVGDKTEVVINGKKCVLMMNPETKQMCAYPLLPPQGKKRRGRPRKPRPGEEGYEPPPPKPAVEDIGNDATADQMSSAAEGLLELSNAGPDGVRRSSRARKKARLLDDYDVLEESGSEEEPQPDDYEADPEVTIAGIKRRKFPTTTTPSTPFGFPGAKRGRGRPRRYPPAGQTTSPSSIPAVIIPTANGQTLMMAPIQGIQNIQALQTQAKTLQKIEPKPSSESSEAVLAISEGSLIPTTPSKLGRETAATSIALDSSNSSILDSSNILINELPTEGGDTDNEDMEPEEKSGEGEEGGEGSGQATIIQIPENMLNMFVQKKDPIKIGIKASETDLERLKCPKCDFQGCYPQQYQDHIATHGDDIHKCKCCNYLTFDKDDLLEHFKDSHSRCICNICHFMAEHAYIIKRHMMRHNAQGCTCEICGKVYKDQYILKMHIKMVHMPAEVLFECTVCSKKFTRKAHLKRHLRIHDPEKPFKCPHCDYRGCERSDISKHLLIHQDPKHVCEVCGKAFRHIKNKELHVKRHNGQRDYKCGVCDFYGYTFTDIRKHIERKHADIKTLVCDRCGSAFKSEMLLREHQKENCEVMMIEQALAIATSSGGTSQATIQFPSTLSVDGKHITIDGQQIAVDQIAVDGDQVNITVEQVSLPDEEEGLTLTEDQVVDGQIAVSEAQVTETGQEVMSEVIHIHQQEEMGQSELEESEEMMTMPE